MISSTRRVSNLAAHLCAPSAAAAAAAAPTMYLNTGAAMPVLGLGTFQASSQLLPSCQAPRAAVYRLRLAARPSIILDCVSW